MLEIVLTLLQEDFNDMDGGAPVTSQPAPGQGTSKDNVAIPMPANSPNPTNPFATEQTSLNTSGQATYTPGKIPTSTTSTVCTWARWWCGYCRPSSGFGCHSFSEIAIVVAKCPGEHLPFIRLTL